MKARIHVDGRSIPQLPDNQQAAWWAWWAKIGINAAELPLHQVIICDVWRGTIEFDAYEWGPDGQPMLSEDEPNTFKRIRRKVRASSAVWRIPPGYRVAWSLWR
jgi:hypothetical protein